MRKLYSMYVKPSFRKTMPIIKTLNRALIDLPAPPNLTIMWNFGSLLGFCLVLQMVTGVLVAFHYTPHEAHAFDSCIHICRDVNYGWILRGLHANGASFFFCFCMYILGEGCTMDLIVYWRRE